MKTIFINPILTSQIPPARARLLGIDHLALGLVEGSRDNWIMFFRAVFGFELDNELSVPDPYGLVRSQVMHSPCHSIRLPLNMSHSLDTQIARSVASYQGTGLQHAAFACDDLPATVETLQSQGLKLLPIPANYYDDLLARYGANNALLQGLERLDILYERDARQQEFLHAYTPPFRPDRFFFELVERRGDYQQYGATNAAVRLAAMQTR